MANANTLEIRKALDKLDHKILLALAQRLIGHVDAGMNKPALIDYLLTSVPERLAPDVETVIRLELRHLETTVLETITQRLSEGETRMSQQIGGVKEQVKEQMKDKVDGTMKSISNLQTQFTLIGGTLAVVAAAAAIFGGIRIVDLQHFKAEQEATIKAQKGWIYRQAVADAVSAMHEVSTLQLLRTNAKIAYNESILESLTKDPDRDVLLQIYKNLLVLGEIDGAAGSHTGKLMDAEERWLRPLPTGAEHSEVTDLVADYVAYQKNVIGVLHLCRFAESQPRRTDLLKSAEDLFEAAQKAKATFNRPKANLGYIAMKRFDCKQPTGAKCDKDFAETPPAKFLEIAEHQYGDALGHDVSQFSRSLTENNMAMFYLKKAKFEEANSKDDRKTDPKKLLDLLALGERLLIEAEHRETRSAVVPETLAQLKAYRLHVELSRQRKWSDEDKQEKVQEIEDLVRMAQAEGLSHDSCAVYVGELVGSVAEFKVLQEMVPNYSMAAQICPRS